MLPRDASLGGLLTPYRNSGCTGLCLSPSCACSPTLGCSPWPLTSLYVPETTHGYLLSELLVLLLQLLAVEAALLQGQGGVPQPLDGVLEALLLLVQLQKAAGG